MIADSLATEYTENSSSDHAVRFSATSVNSVAIEKLFVRRSLFFTKESII